jgi:hypothetical protein
MEVAEKIGICQFLFFRRASVALDGDAKAAPNGKNELNKIKKMLAGVYSLCSGIQNGNLG